MTSYVENVTDQKAKLLSELSNFVRRGSSYCLVDFPAHSNVGDSAIWMGEVALLQQLTGRLPSYATSARKYLKESLAAAAPEGVIFIHGGGNFGDIWPAHQAFRLQLMHDFPGRRIIQLPQSIHFSDATSVAETAEGIAAHPNFHLMVRDLKSFCMAKIAFRCEVTLTPDAAFGMGVLSQPRSSLYPTLCLFRTDVENAGTDYGPLVEALDGHVCDWLAEGPMPRRSLMLKAALAALSAPAPSSAQVEGRFLNLMASHRVTRGLNLLCLGRKVVTDRLHGHILCTMMGKPHIALDNNYGKIGAYHDQWLKGVSGAGHTINLYDAIEAARNLPN